MKKEIANVVFYKFNGEHNNMQQACIFYTDGTVKNTTVTEGIEAAEAIAREEKIKNKAGFVDLLNQKRVYTLTGKEFERRFKEFLEKANTSNQRSIIPVTKVAENNGENETSSTETKIKSGSNGTQTSADGLHIPPVVPGVSTKTTKKKKSWFERIKDKYTSIKNKVKRKGTRLFNSKNKKNKNNQNWFKRTWKRATAGVLAIVMFLTGGFLIGKKSHDHNVSANQNAKIASQGSLKSQNIDAQDIAYSSLINKTTNNNQSRAMQNQSENLDSFNRDFSKMYLEKNKKVKAALTWDEMMALNLAYNNYTKEQIKSMFNGTEIEASTMSNAYKNATLQLMGAYVISNRENPVPLSQILVTQKQKDFVEKYNNLFYKCKETTGAEQIQAINNFYKELYKDFPISDEVREVGISHAEGRKELEPFKTAITPIVAATEIMFQNNDKIDHTLSDKAIAYFNDIGLCNFVDEQFERVETITLSAETDINSPLYTEYRKTKINELISEGNYSISDEDRDLSQLDAFKKWVNGHFAITNGVNTGELVESTTSSYTMNESTTRTESTSTSTTDRKEAVKQAGESAVSKAEREADKVIDSENIANKHKAEQDAENKRQEMQNAEAVNKDKLEDKVATDDKDFQNKIDQANNSNKKPNENDFGNHGVDFAPEHSDKDGTLNDSVGNITTDSSGAVDSNEPLPDPNQTGAIFDGMSDSLTEETILPQNTSGQEIYEYEEAYSQPLSNEEIVDRYIAQLAFQEPVETGYQYTKK